MKAKLPRQLTGHSSRGASRRRSLAEILLDLQLSVILQVSITAWIWGEFLTCRKLSTVFVCSTFLNHASFVCLYFVPIIYWVLYWGEFLTCRKLQIQHCFLILVHAWGRRRGGRGGGGGGGGMVGLWPLRSGAPS